MWLRVWLLTSLCCIASAVGAGPVSGDKIGIILLHAKWSKPAVLSRTASHLRNAGALVSMPIMPWSRDRAYAKSYEASMQEIDQAAAALREQGAKRIIVAGHSMGANAALGYGARRPGLAGVILLAPGHVPGIPGYAKKVASSVEKARRLVAQGKGDARKRFKDINQGKTRTLRVRADVYLSWFDPNGPAVMAVNAKDQRDDAPVLCIQGKKERFKRCSQLRRYFPKNPKTRIHSVNASHKHVPVAAHEAIIEWLAAL